MEQLTISNITIDVIRKDIKNIHLAVYPPTGRVRLAAPINVTEDAIRLFAISKLGWIKRHQREYEGQERIGQREFKERESHYFEGKRYLLKIIEAEGKQKIVLKNKSTIYLYVRPETTLEKKQELINEWYRAELKKHIPQLIAKWETILNVKVDDWQVKQMKTKWGSCNIERRKIWINLELAKKPVRCLEFIIVHELIHLIEKYHNERFYYYLTKYLPAWKKLKVELNRIPISHANWNY